MIKFGELNDALTIYTCSDVHDKIPVDYYRRVIKTAIKLNNYGQHWDLNQASSVLLYLAFNDGHLHPSQLTDIGLKALDHAEMILQKADAPSGQADKNLKNTDIG